MIILFTPRKSVSRHSFNVPYQEGQYHGPLGLAYTFYGVIHGYVARPVISYVSFIMILFVI